MQLKDDIHSCYKLYRYIEEAIIRTGKLPDTHWISEEYLDVDKIIRLCWQSHQDKDADVAIASEKNILNESGNYTKCNSIIVVGNLISDYWGLVTSLLSRDFLLMVHDVNQEEFDTISLWIKKDVFKDIMANL